MQVIDLSGQRFGRLLVLRRNGTKNTFAAWLVRCDCGREYTASGHELRKGTTRSCGCDKVRVQRMKVTRHGQTGSPTWKSWESMRQRCLRPSDPSYARYGGRGIRVCDRWDTFEAFIEDMGPRPSIRHTLDRIDVDGDYAPGNCRWALPKEQGRNRRNNRILTHGGHTRTLAEWAEVTGLQRTAITERIRRGWTVAEALSTPL